jgi:hypothetical protein
LSGEQGAGSGEDGGSHPIPTPPVSPRRVVCGDKGGESNIVV